MNFNVVTILSHLSRGATSKRPAAHSRHEEEVRTSCQIGITSSTPLALR
jgi:hypothetical protein